jgi:hypothetical protein
MLLHIPLNETPAYNAFCGSVAVLRMCCSLMARIEITFDACVKRTFRVALYNGVRLISVWLLLFCQCIYVFAYIICNHLVFRFATTDSE